MYPCGRITPLRGVRTGGMRMRLRFAGSLVRVFACSRVLGCVWGLGLGLGFAFLGRICLSLLGGACSDCHDSGVVEDWSAWDCIIFK